MSVRMSMSVRMVVTRIVPVVVAVLMVMVVMVMVAMIFPAGGAVTFMRSVMCHPFRDP
jgi:hypothetical protein